MLLNGSVQVVPVFQITQAPTSFLPRDAGEDEGGGLNGLNILNFLNDHFPVLSSWSRIGLYFVAPP
jgi:hypothetical protein